MVGYARLIGHNPPGDSARDAAVLAHLSAGGELHSLLEPLQLLPQPQQDPLRHAVLVFPVAGRLLSP